MKTINWIFRCYTDPVRRDMDSLKSIALIDEEERSLKGIKNYNEALTHTVAKSPELRDYMSKYILFSTGDWPTWYFEKKIIAQVQTTTKHTPKLELSFVTVFTILSDCTFYFFCQSNNFRRFQKTE